jgi:hypothetical protein
VTPTRRRQSDRSPGTDGTARNEVPPSSAATVDGEGDVHAGAVLDAQRLDRPAHVRRVGDEQPAAVGGEQAGDGEAAGGRPGQVVERAALPPLHVDEHQAAGLVLAVERHDEPAAVR